MTIRSDGVAGTRGADCKQSSMFSYISAERRVPKDHPLRAIRAMADAALKELDQRFVGMYTVMGHPSIPPERLLRALLLQVLYTVCSERLLMEQLDYNFLFRWFVGLSIDAAVWDVTVFSKTRDRLLKGEVAEAFFGAVLAQARERGLLSDEHFTVEGTLIEAWAGQKSFKHQDSNVAERSPKNDEPATRAWTFTASGVATISISPRATRMRAWPAREQARKPSSTTPATC